MTDQPIQFVGHTNALSTVHDAFASGRMPHAWLITGIEGIGKAALAKHIAEYVLSNGEGELGKPNPTSPTARLVEADTHPDLLIIRRERDEKTGILANIIPVEEVSKVAPFFHKTAAHSGWRVVIIDEAHTLNRYGQNAILKIVEEPPPNALVLLTATTPGILLPTIRSRTRHLQLAPLNMDEMRTLLRATAPNATAEDVTAVIDLSGGSIGFALKILRSETLPLYREMLAMLDAMPQLDTASLHKLADKIAKKADSEAFEALSILLIERLRSAARNEANRHPDSRVETALKIWEKTKATFASAEYSALDRKLAFITALTDIRAAMQS